MRHKTLFFILAFMAFSVPGHSEEGKLPPRPRLMDERFVVETSETDLDDSLNRLAGLGDHGYASEEYTYRSENHGKAGPFGRQDAFDNSQTHGY